MKTDILKKSDGTFIITVDADLTDLVTIAAMLKTTCCTDGMAILMQLAPNCNIDILEQKHQEFHDLQGLIADKIGEETERIASN